MEGSLLSYRDRLKTKDREGKKLIFDPIRKKWLVLLPEELVRQLLIHYLLDQGIAMERIQVERGLTVNGVRKRFDIVIYDKDVKPYIICECKSHKVKINQATVDQAGNYNISLKAPYLLVTNGLTMRIVHIDFSTKTFEEISALPTQLF